MADHDYLAHADRLRLCDLMVEVGPAAPTLCEGWSTKDLAADLVARDRRPDSVPGLVVERLSGWSEKVRAGGAGPALSGARRRAAERPAALVAAGLGAADRLGNTHEMFVHYEDVRRVRPGWEPRTLVAQDEDDLWRVLGWFAGRAFGRARWGSSCVGPTARVAPSATAHAVVTVTGPPGELLLFAFGRRTTPGSTSTANPARSPPSAGRCAGDRRRGQGRHATHATGSLTASEDVTHLPGSGSIGDGFGGQGRRRDRRRVCGGYGDVAGPARGARALAHVTGTNRDEGRDPLNWDAFITCAITGAGDTIGRSPHVPVTPEQIADSAIEAAGRGRGRRAHPRPRPRDRQAARATELYARGRRAHPRSGVDVVLNLTAGMGGDLVLGGDEAPLPPDADGTDMAGATERLDHVAELLPEICTLDCGTMNFASGGDYIMVNTPGVLRAMAKQVQELGVRPELEVFDTGHLVLVKELIRRGLIDDPVHDPALHGHPLRRAGRPDDAAGDGQPAAAGLRCSRRSRSAACSCRTSRMAALAGGNVRVGLEDNLYLEPRRARHQRRARRAGRARSSRR